MTRPRVDAADAATIARGEWAAVLALALLGLVVRLALWSTQSIPSVDGTAYLRIAQSFAGGPPVDSVHQYGYPVLIALAHLVVPDWVTAARAVAFVSGVMLIPLTWFLTTPFVADRRLRLLPAAFLVVTPLAIRYSLTTMTEMPFLAILFLSLALAARERRLAAGVVAGLAYTIRPEGLLAILIVAALQWGRPHAAFRWRRPGAALRLVAGAALVVAPYVMAVGLADGRWTLTPKSLNIAAGTWMAAEEQAGAAPVGRDVADRLERFGGETARLYPARARDVIVALATHSGYLPLLMGPAGLVGPALILAAGLVQIAFLPLTFIGARVRYIFPFLPILWILSTIAIARVGRATWRVALAALLVGSVALSAWSARDLYTMNEDGYFPELVEAGRWLRDFSTPATVIYDRKPYTAYYAGAEGRFTPAGSRDAILNEIVARRGDYLVVNDWITERFRPELLPLARDASVVAVETRLSPVYFERSTRGMRTLIYRVVRPGGPPAIPGEGEIKAAVLDVLATNP